MREKKRRAREKSQIKGGNKEAGTELGRLKGRDQSGLGFARSLASPGNTHYYRGSISRSREASPRGNDSSTTTRATRRIRLHPSSSEARQVTASSSREACFLFMRCQTYCFSGEGESLYKVSRILEAFVMVESLGNGRVVAGRWEEKIQRLSALRGLHAHLLQLASNMPESCPLSSPHR